jgi:hypothetical protein
LVADDGIVYSSYEQEQNIPAINISDSCAWVVGISVT